jgi:hypothetical protein
MAKIVRLTEQDLVRLVNRVINEQTEKEKEFVNSIKKRFISKGYKVRNYGNINGIQTIGLLNMTKGKEYSVNIMKDGPNKLKLELSKHLINPKTKKYEFSSIEIHVVNYDESIHGGGPTYRYKVDYYGDGGKFIKSESLNGYQFGELIDKQP